MKHDLKLLVAAVIALGLPAAAHASTLTQAQITQIIKDVKTIDPAKGSRAAILKETLQGDQSVRTGMESRSELLFNDQTLTRLGANTHFSFSEGTRNMSLQSGVMLLQVPKGAGGAKIETAAVTAAVTGTTIMLEAGKTYTKLIVLEGECCVWPKNDKNENKFFKFKHKTCLVAGQELILRNGAKTIPDPVYVNLKILEGSSLLVTGKWGAPLNTGPVNAAADGQGPNDFIPTNLAIVGAGTDVVVITDQTPQQPPNNPPGNPPGTPPNLPPGKYGALTTINPGSPYGIGGGSTINTDPTITTGGVTSYGRIYRGPILDGQPAQYFFGNNPSIASSDFNNNFLGVLDESAQRYGVAAFKFTSLTLSDLPTIEMSGNGADNLILVSEGDITVSSPTPKTLDFPQLYGLGLFTPDGNIDIDSNITITGLTGYLGLYNHNPASNITVDGLVDLPNAEFFAGTKGTFSGTGTVNAQTIDIRSGGVVTLSESVDDSKNTIDTVNNVTIGVDPLQTLMLTGNEIDIPTGFFGQASDSEGPTVDLILNSHSNGADLPGDINLTGAITVHSLTANADNNITVTTNTDIESFNNIAFTAGGTLEIDGTANSNGGGAITGTAGGNIVTGSDASINTNNGTIQFNSTGGDVTFDGNISAPELDGTGNNVYLLSTDQKNEDNISIDGPINITASGSVKIAGTVFASSLTVTNSNSVLVTGSATINAGSITLTANNTIEVDGVIQGQDGAASNFTSNSSGASGEDPGTQDFFGTGSINAATISITSAGDLVLQNSKVNGVAIDPNNGLQELDLNGATIEVSNAFIHPTVTIKATANSDITIGGSISVAEFDASTSTQIIVNGEGTSITARTVSLNIPNLNGALSQTGSFAFNYVESTTGSGSTVVSSIPINLSGSAATLSVSANSLAVGNITAPSGTMLNLNLSSLNDINSGTSATINKANSVALQVGVDAVLAGDGNANISYNGGQLTIDDSKLTTFSVSANSIEVNSGFPSPMSKTFLVLNASGSNGISINTNLNIASGSFTASGGDVNANSSLTTGSGGSLYLSGNNVTVSTVTTGAGGDLTLNANNGGISVNLGGLNIGGNFTATASSDIFIGFIDPTVGGSMSLNSTNGAIELDSNITINGSLTLSAGTFIHSFNSSTIFGATDATLTLAVPAEISVTPGDSDTLYFDVPAASEQDGFGPLGIDMSNLSSVTATAPQLTLTSGYDEPGISLNLTATSGTLLINGAVTASSFSGSSSVTITGSGGSITAQNVSLLQGGPATISQSGTTSFSYNGLNVAINPTEGGATSLTLSANPLTLTNALTLSGVDLSLSGVVNTQNNPITAQNVTLYNLQTTTVSGNATNLGINAYSLTFSDMNGNNVNYNSGVNLNGIGNGSGGMLTGTTASNPGNSGEDNDIEVNEPVTATGGSASGHGGTVTLNALGELDLNAFVVVGESYVFVNGYIDASGGSSSAPGVPGGNGGAVNLTSGSNSILNINGSVTANGGDATPTGGASGGDGGTVNLNAGSDLNVNSNVTASSGVNSNTKFTGGSGGTVNLTSQNGTVNVNATVEASSSNLQTNRISARGGNINVTSHKTTGVAINISDSGQLNALLNQAAPGPGGVITFVADKGGNINVNGKVRADHGTINIQNQATTTDTTLGNVTLNGANLSADIVKVATLAPNGTLTIGGGVINGDSAIQLYAAGANGTVQFVANTSLTGASVKSIAGNTVTVNNGVNVYVSGNAATVYTNNPNYNVAAGGNGSTTGAFINGNSHPLNPTNTTTQPFASRPAF